TISFENMRFNFIRARGTIRISTSYHNIAGVNYCKFNSDFEKDFIYYAYVMNYQYINDNNTEITLLIDEIMTFFQCYTLNNFNTLMDKLSPYAWITQNIRSVSLVPSILLENKTVKEDPQSFNFNHLYSLRDNGTTTLNRFDRQLLKISKTLNELYKTFGLDP